MAKPVPKSVWHLTHHTQSLAHRAHGSNCKHTYTYMTRNVTNQYLIKYSINDTKVQVAWADKKRFNIKGLTRVNFALCSEENEAMSYVDSPGWRNDWKPTCEKVIICDQRTKLSGNRQSGARLGGKVTDLLYEILNYWLPCSHSFTQQIIIVHQYVSSSVGLFFRSASWFPHLENTNANLSL